MPVNLLPQTPPQNTPQVKPADNADDPNATTFGAELSAAQSAAAPSSTPRGAGETDKAPRTTPLERDKQAERTLDALALLGLPGLVTPPLVGFPTVPTTVPVTEGEVPVDVAVAPKTGERGVESLPTPAPRTAPEELRAALLPAGLAAEPKDQPATPEITAMKTAPADAEAPRAAVRMPPEPARAALPAAAVERPAPISATDVLKVAEHATGAHVKAAATESPANIEALTATPVVAAAPSPSPAPPLQLDIATPALTTAWRQEVVDHVAQLVVLRQDRAEIRVHPEDLGPISVQIRFDGSEANLLIQAPQPATRDALDLALPQLRDALAQQGITLGQASVRDDARRDDEPAAGGGHGGGSGTASTSGAEPIDVRRVTRGLVDLFA